MADEQNQNNNDPMTGGPAPISPNPTVDNPAATVAPTARPQARVDQPDVSFTPAQIKVINQMLADRLDAERAGDSTRRSPNNAISMYNLRDPKKIETVKVSRFESKWVVGFKNLQNDPFKKGAAYLRYGIDPVRKLPREPYVTLMLSADGKNIEEREVLLIDYMDNRDTVDVSVLDVEVKPEIHDHGVLGTPSGYGIAVNEKGNPESRPTILAQSKSEKRTFKVHLEGFAEPTWFITDFLG